MPVVHVHSRRPQRKRPARAAAHQHCGRREIPDSAHPYVCPERGWRNLRLLSSAHNSFNADYHGETSDGGQIPALNVFVRRDGKIYHFYNTELLYAQSTPGQDPRHVDLIWPLWNLFDLTPEGRGTKWNPQLAYGDEGSR